MKDYLCYNTTSEFENCVIVGNDNNCYDCVDGYYLKQSDKKCYKAEGNYSNCRQTNKFDGCSFNKEICKECKKGYTTLSNGSCGYNPNCFEDSYGFCEGCEDGYTSSYNLTCVYNPQCDSTITDNLFNIQVCDKCKEGYYLNNDLICVKNDVPNNSSSSGCESLVMILILMIVILL